MQFTCPHCGTTKDVADGSAGESCVCLHCGQAATIPEVGGAGPKRRRSFLLNPFVLFFLLLIGVDTIGMGISLVLPGVQAAREAARRVQCAENLKRIGLAMQNYQQRYECFPPAFIPDENGKPKHSWRVLILPFLEQDALYRDYRFDEPWDSPHNIALSLRMPSVYCCPTETAPGTSQTSYAMIVGPHAISDGPTPRKMGDITDGLSTTIMVAECAGARINWLEPRDLDAEKTTNVEMDRGDGKNPLDAIRTCHPKGANVLFCDGTTRSINYAVDEKFLKAMLTIDGGETISMEYLGAICDDHER